MDLSYLASTDNWPSTLFEPKKFDITGSYQETYTLKERHDIDGIVCVSSEGCIAALNLTHFGVICFSRKYQRNVKLQGSATYKGCRILEDQDTIAVMQLQACKGGEYQMLCTKTEDMTNSEFCHATVNALEKIHKIQYDSILSLHPGSQSYRRNVKVENHSFVPDLLHVYQNDWPEFCEIFQQKYLESDIRVHVYYVFKIFGQQQLLPNVQLSSYVNLDKVQQCLIHLATELYDTHSVIAWNRSFAEYLLGPCTRYHVFGSAQMCNASAYYKHPNASLVQRKAAINGYHIVHAKLYMSSQKMFPGQTAPFEDGFVHSCLSLGKEWVNGSKERTVKFEHMAQHLQYKQLLQFAKELGNGTPARFEVVVDLACDGNAISGNYSYHTVGEMSCKTCN